ncbi:MAG: thioredoxin family protein [Verrucomicrobia bacterium]|nr:thioredoxin family protein [Verrucomicrobiota bacterium]
MNRYLVVTLIVVVAIFLSRGERFRILEADDVTEERLAKTLEEAKGKVLLYFWQPECPSSDLMTPIVDEVAKEYAKNLTVLKLDTTDSDNRAVHDAYEINTTPSFVVIHKGKVVSQWVGPFKNKNTFITYLKPSGAY